MTQYLNADGNAPLPQNDNEGLLTLQDIADRLAVKYGRLRGLADEPGVKEAVGAVPVPGVKGVRYPPSAEGLFRRLIAASDAGEVTPKTAVAWLARERDTLPPGAAADGPPPSAALTQWDNRAGLDGRAVGAVLTQLLHQNAEALRLLAESRPPTEDRLLTAEQAADLLACRPRSVGRYVRPVRPGVYRHSDILAYIAGLTQR